MSNKWKEKSENKENRYVVVLMISRNKDNKNLPNFKERIKSYFCSYNWEKICTDFDSFVNKGQENEFCRLYISLNARDSKKVQKALMHELLDIDLDFDTLNAKVASIAAKKENAYEHKWFFDFDCDSERAVNQFINDILAIDVTTVPEAVKTPHGYAVIVQHGFDTRELMTQWENVSLKRDDLICKKWIRAEK